MLVTFILLIKKLKIEEKMKICKICRYGYSEDILSNKHFSFSTLFNLQDICQNCLFKLYMRVEDFVSKIVNKD